MSTDSSSTSTPEEVTGGAEPEVAGTEPDVATDGDDGQSFDAAEAAGFGGIAWAEGGPDGAVNELADGGDLAAGQSADALDGAVGPDGADANTAETNTDENNTVETSAGSEPGVVEGDGLAAGEGGVDNTEMSVEDLVSTLEQVTIERDQYLDASRRVQAEFENYRKAVAKREADAKERAAESLISALLPVLDACDGALASGATDVEPVRSSLVEVLTKQGLDRIDDQDSSFDPSRHEAVMHEPDDGSGEGPVVAEVMRAGYSWKGRVVRPAMVRVRG